MLTIITNSKELQSLRNNFTNSKIGFVPTMGNLHEGHLSLFKKSLDENELSIISIFVNPKQFAPNEDFNKYPRTLSSDIEKIKSITNDKHKVIIFAPEKIEEIYPPGFSTTISIGKLGTILCGKSRQGHFDGVTTVVYQLLQLTKPTTAYFGLKDYQQFVIIKKMVSDLLLDIKIVGMPTIRNQYDLALSSRNQYLNEEEMNIALTLNKTLKKIIASMRESNFNLEKTKEEISLILKDTRFEYLEIRSQDTLDETIINNKFVVLGAFKLGSTRLIDNLLFP